MTTSGKRGLFAALLKHWRHKRGLSQLDLALAADVSSRHVSFLETGRSVPSEDMVLRLATTLDVPLRHVNALLEAAGHAPRYAQADLHDLSPEVRAAIDQMKQHHNPFPLVVIDRCYQVLDLNIGARNMFEALVPGGLADLNLARLTFDPQGATLDRKL